MENFKKILNGEVYNFNTPEFKKQAVISDKKLRQFNNFEIEVDEWFGHVGKDVAVKRPFRCDLGFRISIGDESFINYNAIFLDMAPITIGKHVFIGPNATFVTPIHPLDVKTRNAFYEIAKPITIEDNVWLATNVTVMPGVTIGHGAVIGAGSVVTKDIPPNYLAYGNPCRLIHLIDQENRSDLFKGAQYIPV